MRNIVCSFMVTSLLIVAGCAKSDGNVLVTGTITQGGVAVEGASVMFIPDGGTGEGASGRTDSEGKYVLTTSTGKSGTGTKPGTYKVTVSKTVSEWDGRSYRTVSEDGEYVQVEDRTTKHLLPLSYNSLANTPLKATVTENKDDNVFNFDIP